MIGRLLRYPYGCVRARARATRLIPLSEMTGLAGSESREKAGERIRGMLSAAGDQEHIERLLQEGFLRFGQATLETLPQRAAQVLRAYLKRNWLENLLTLCRALLGQQPAGTVPALLPVLDSPPLAEPGTVGSLGELAAGLPENFRRVLNSRGDKAGQAELPAIENGLIRTYWTEVAERVARLPQFDRATARDILCLRADLDALRILFRGRQVGLEAEEMLAAWPPLASRLDPVRLQRLLRSAESGDDLLGLANRTFGLAAKGADEVEACLRRRLFRESRRWLRSAPLGIAVPLGSLFLKELELTDLTGLLGGLRYELGQDRLTSAFAGVEG